MKSTLAIAFLFVAGYLSPAATAHAQSLRMQAHVPFSFSSGETWMPAGVYQIATVEQTPFITISDHGKHQATLMGRHGPDTTGNGNRLVFHKYGNRYFLSAIHGREGGASVQLPVTKAEKRAKLNSLEAGLRVEEPVLVAMN